MSEQKRATLSTISTQKCDVKKVKEKSKTIRFTLTLPESNEKSCPEYNYRDLLNSAEKKNKSKEKVSEHVNGLNHLDPFGDDDNDDDVKRIAKQFEEKYGGVPRKKRRGKKDDYADIGAGYDETDSFIDNTDAYDEVVPENVTTAYGGFYINSGALEFKQIELSGSENSDTNDSDKINASRKRVVEDSEESDSENEDKETKKEEKKTDHLEKKQKIETNGISKPVVTKKKLLPDEKEVMRKRKIDELINKKKSVTVKDLLRERREEFDITAEPESQSVLKDKQPATSSNAAVSNTIHAVIESVINAGRKVNPEENTKDSISSDDVAVVSVGSTDSESSRDALPPPPQLSETQNEPVKEKEPEIPTVSLPENLPPKILDLINNLKKAAENSSQGKVKFFTGSVNKMLLNLDINCRKLQKQTRIQVYEHLAPFVKCKKDTLMRRAKNLLLDQEKSKLENPISRLKVIVLSIMPLIKKQYEKECQKVRDEMFHASAAANAENGDTNSKVRRIPRKKFPWSEESRKNLQEIVICIKKCFALERNRKDTFENYLETYLKSTVLPIWPEGWMSIAALKKQAKFILEASEIKASQKFSPSAAMTPISLDISATVSPVIPFAHSPVKTMSPSANPNSGITVIPIPQTTSPKLTTAQINGPKLKHHSPTIKSNDTSALIVNKKSTENIVVEDINNSSSAVSSSLLIPSSNNKSSVTITSVDLRTNNKKEQVKDDELTILISNTTTNSDQNIVSSSMTVTPSVQSSSVSVKPTNLKQRILNDNLISSKSSSTVATTTTQLIDTSDQIIDLTDSPINNTIRKPGPKSKTRYIEPGGTVKLKKIKDLQKPPEEITGTQALNQIITGLTKYGSTTQQESNSTTSNKINYSKETPTTTSQQLNEDDMEQVMKDLKELQQLQEHARKHDMENIMSPSSSPVSVIAFNSSFSPTKINDISPPKERKLSVDGSGYQDIFQKQLYPDSSMLKSAQSSSLYNTNVQPKNSYNSVNNFSYTSAGNISNTMSNIRYSQSSNNKYSSSMNHLPTNSTGTTTNHTDDFALLQNFLYQYGFHNTSGSKQKSPP